MASKTVEIVLKARNNLMRGLRSAGASLKKFGAGLANIGKAIAKGFLVAGAAITGITAKLVQAFGVQEKAEKQVEAAFRAYGEEVTANTAAVKRFAAAIQNQTGIADENTIANAAQLKLLGVQTDQLEAAAKATIALQKAGMGEATALRAVALASQGNFEALQRYIPALRSATTDAEKAAIVNDFVTKSYQAQRDELNTVSGRWNEFKGRIGDVLEQLGGVIAKDAGLTAMLKRAADGVQKFGENIAKWLSGGGVSRTIATWKLFFENLRHGFNNISAWVNVAGSAIVDGFRAAFTRSMAAGKALFDGLKAVFTGDLGGIKKAGKAIADAFAMPVQPERTAAALRQIQAEAERHAEAVAQIQQQQTESTAKAAGDRVKAEKEAQDAIVIAAENAQAKIKTLKDKELNQAKRVAEMEKDAKKRALQEHIADLEKAQAKRKALSKKTVDQILEEARRQKEADEEWARAQRKAARLRDRQGRGVKLSRKQQQWLDAFARIEGAKGKVQAGAQAIQGAKQRLDAMNLQGKKLEDIKAELMKTRQQLNQLMMRK